MVRTRTSTCNPVPALELRCFSLQGSCSFRVHTVSLLDVLQKKTNRDVCEPGLRGREKAWTGGRSSESELGCGRAVRVLRTWWHIGGQAGRRWESGSPPHNKQDSRAGVFVVGGVTSRTR